MLQLYVVFLQNIETDTVRQAIGGMGSRAVAVSYVMDCFVTR